MNQRLTRATPDQVSKSRIANLKSEMKQLRIGTFGISLLTNFAREPKVEANEAGWRMQAHSGFDP